MVNLAGILRQFFQIFLLITVVIALANAAPSVTKPTKAPKPAVDKPMKNGGQGMTIVLPDEIKYELQTAL